MTRFGQRGQRPEALELHLWLKEIGRIASDLKANAKLSRLIRRSFYLSQLAPEPFWSEMAAECDDLEFEACMDVDDLASATLRFFGSGLSITFEQIGDERICIIKAPKLNLAGSSRSSDINKARLGAWLNCILAVHTASPEPKSKVVSFSQHLMKKRLLKEAFAG